jgi:mannose-6-phosphate isomerase-like protein (cupin superfamily)
MTPTPTPSVLSIPTLLSQLTEIYSPRLVASINNEYDIKVAKIRGPFVWHSHPDTDELFYILNGSLTIQIETEKEEEEGGMIVEDVVLVKGDVFVVPKGVRHRPTTREGEGDGAEVMLIERCGTVNTGDEIGSGMRREVVDVRGR